MATSGNKAYPMSVPVVHEPLAATRTQIGRQQGNRKTAPRHVVDMANDMAAKHHHPSVRPNKARRVG